MGSQAGVGFVLVHGGAHRGRCWEPVIPHLVRPAISEDLPGRGDRPAELRRVGVPEFAAAVVADIEAAGYRRAILVGHSVAGVVLPEVAQRIPDRIAHLVFVSCAIPPEGRNVIQDLPRGAAPLVRWQTGRDVIRVPGFVARRTFCNDMDDTQTRTVLAQLCPEAPRLVTDQVSRRSLSPAIPRTYIMLLRDRALPLRFQRRQIRNFGGCEVLGLDAGHDAFISQPRALAQLLNAVALTVPL